MRYIYITWQLHGSKWWITLMNTKYDSYLGTHSFIRSNHKLNKTKIELLLNFIIKFMVATIAQSTSKKLFSNHFLVIVQQLNTQFSCTFGKLKFILLLSSRSSSKKLYYNIITTSWSYIILEVWITYSSSFIYTTAKK